jgi:hypothetical protein
MLFRTSAIALLTLALAGCSGGNVLGPNTTASGNIIVTNTLSAQKISGSQQSQLQVTGGFSVALSEANYNGSFAGGIVSFTNPTNLACFTVTSIGPASFTISPANAAIPSSGNPNPCVAGDSEEASFSDSKGNSVAVFFKLTTSLSGTAAATST